MRPSKQVRWINDVYTTSERESGDCLAGQVDCGSCLCVVRLSANCASKTYALLSGPFTRQRFCRFLLQEAMWVHSLCVLRCFHQCMAWCSVTQGFVYSLAFTLSLSLLWPCWFLTHKLFLTQTCAYSWHSYYTALWNTIFSLVNHCIFRY